MATSTHPSPRADEISRSVMFSDDGATLQHSLTRCKTSTTSASPKALTVSKHVVAVSKQHSELQPRERRVPVHKAPEHRVTSRSLK